MFTPNKRYVNINPPKTFFVAAIEAQQENECACKWPAQEVLNDEKNQLSDEYYAQSKKYKNVRKQVNMHQINNPIEMSPKIPT